MRSVFFFFSILLLSLPLAAQTTDAQGRKQGYWKKKDPQTNKLIYEGEFKDDKPVGKFKYYYPTDSVQAIFSFRNDGKISYAWLFHPSGRKMAQGKYLNEYKHKDIDRIKDSIWMYYDDFGVLLSKESYLKGKKNGTCYVYYPNGTVSEERNYKDGIDHGSFKQYYEDKKLKAEGNYVNGKLEGKNAYYYPSGFEAAVGYYKNGAKNGPWLYRDSKGTLKERELYKDGKLASKKESDAFFAKTKIPAPANNTQQKSPAKKP